MTANDDGNLCLLLALQSVAFEDGADYLRSWRCVVFVRFLFFFIYFLNKASRRWHTAPPGGSDTADGFVKGAFQGCAWSRLRMTDLASARVLHTTWTPRVQHA